MRCDVLIVGGGPGGATSALLLARAGRRVVVAEKNAFPRRKVCGELLAASGIALLQRLGLGPRFDSMAGPEVDRIALWAGSHALDAAMPPLGRALARDHLDSLLLEEAARAGALIVKGEKEIQADTVIRACGSWQRNARPRASDLFGFQAHFTGARVPARTIALIPFPGGYGGLVERAGGRATFAACIRRDRLGRIRSSGVPAGEALLRHAMHSCSVLKNILGIARREGAWLAAGPLHPGMRLLYENGVFNVGNAAGEAHPVVGEGMAMAMQSGALAAEALLRNTEIDKAGVEYARAWRARFPARIRASAAFAHLAMLPGAPGLVGLLNLFPRILESAARLSGKTLPGTP
jgi:menaquinone-9 beta-reductase